MYPFRILTPYLVTTHFKIITSTPNCAKWSPPFRSSEQYSVCTYRLSNHPLCVNGHNYMGQHCVKQRAHIAHCVQRLRAESQRYQSSIPDRTAFRLALETSQSPIQWVPRFLSPALKRLGCEGDHSPTSSTEVTNSWSYMSIPPALGAFYLKT